MQEIPAQGNRCLLAFQRLRQNFIQRVVQEADFALEKQLGGVIRQSKMANFSGPNVVFKIAFCDQIEEQIDVGLKQKSTNKIRQNLIGQEVHFLNVQRAQIEFPVVHAKFD